MTNVGVWIPGRVPLNLVVCLCRFFSILTYQKHFGERFEPGHAPKSAHGDEALVILYAMDRVFGVMLTSVCSTKAKK